jgi:hypothetical protein
LKPADSIRGCEIGRYLSDGREHFGIGSALTQFIQPFAPRNPPRSEDQNNRNQKAPANSSDTTNAWL